MNRGENFIAQTLEQLAKLPSPDKLYAELQRLNANMEKLQPDIHKLAQATDGLYVSDIRLLTQVLQGMKINDMLRVLTETKEVFEKLYAKLWGR